MIIKEPALVEELFRKLALLDIVKLLIQRRAAHFTKNVSLFYRTERRVRVEIIVVLRWLWTKNEENTKGRLVVVLRKVCHLPHR